MNEATTTPPYRMLTDWDRFFLGMAEYVSRKSKDPSTQVGAIITRGRRVVSIGFNGLPRGVRDLPERLHDRETKYRMIRHAEANAMDFAETSLSGCTLYTHPFMPCAQCAGQAIQRGIIEVVSYSCDIDRWQGEFELSRQQFVEAGVRLLLFDPLIRHFVSA